MKKNILKKFLIGSVIISGVTSFGFVLYDKLYTKINYIHANYIADFSDDKKLLGTSDNVFVGKVITNKGLADQKGTSEIPETLFDVEILYNIKGHLKGNITVKQEGGYDKYNNLYITEGNKYMEKGEIYLLATKGNSYTIISHENGSHLISDNINNNDINKIIKQNKKINDFRKAYKEEVYYQEDSEGGKFKISTEKNAYKYLNQKEKDNFENIENGFNNIVE